MLLYFFGSINWLILNAHRSSPMAHSQAAHFAAQHPNTLCERCRIPLPAFLLPMLSPVIPRALYARSIATVPWERYLWLSTPPVSRLRLLLPLLSPVIPRAFYARSIATIPWERYLWLSIPPFSRLCLLLPLLPPVIFLVSRVVPVILIMIPVR